MLSEISNKIDSLENKKFTKALMVKLTPTYLTKRFEYNYEVRNQIHKRLRYALILKTPVEGIFEWKWFENYVPVITKRFLDMWLFKGFLWVYIVRSLILSHSLENHSFSLCPWSFFNYVGYTFLFRVESCNFKTCLCWSKSDGVPEKTGKKKSHRPSQLATL